MRKNLLLLALLLLGTTAFAQSSVGTLSVGNQQNVVPGYTGSFDVELTGSDHTYRDFQLDITLPSGLTYTGYSAGALLNGHSVHVSDQGSSTHRFTGYTTANKTMTAQNEKLLTIHFTVDSEASGTLAGGNLGAITFSDASAVAYHPADAGFSVTTSNAITISDAETFTPRAVSNVSVTVKRAVSASNWNTIVLPFSMTDDQLKAAFGDDYQLAGFAGYMVSGDHISVAFTTTTTLDAHTPYIIKPSTDVATSFTVDGVNMTTATNNLTTDASEGGKTKKMIGVYAETTIPANGLYLKSNAFKYSTGSSKVKPFRAYFQLDEADFNPTGSSPSAHALDIDVFDMTTGLHQSVRSLDSDTADDDYNLSGQRIGKTEKGVHISNGQKKIVK